MLMRNPQQLERVTQRHEAPARGRRAGWGVGCALALWMQASAAFAVVSVVELRETLDAHDVPIPEALLGSALEQAFISAIDPGARILPMATSNAVPASSLPALAEVEHLPGDIMYCPVHALNGKAAVSIRSALADWTNAPGAGVILDLRNAGGTDLSDVDAVAGLFLPPGEALYSVSDGLEHILETHYAQGDASNSSALPPCILLIGTNTLDASEILAACLVDRQKIMLIGTPTRGATALREALPLSDGRMLQITTRWIVPFERPAFQGKGVKPHLHVRNSAQSDHLWVPSESSHTGRRPLSPKAKLQRQLLERVADDAALSRAADLLLSLKALGQHDVSGTNENASTIGD